MATIEEVIESVINILKHLKTVPLDEVHENIDAAITGLRGDKGVQEP